MISNAVENPAPDDSRFAAGVRSGQDLDCRDWLVPDGSELPLPPVWAEALYICDEKHLFTT